MKVTINHGRPVEVEPFASWNDALREMVAADQSMALDPRRDDAHQGCVEDRLFATPAPDLHAVLYKLSRIWGHERDPIEGYQDLIRADIERLAALQ